MRLRELIAAREDPDVSLGDLAYEPLVVPETKSVTGLLAEMQEKSNHMAVVVDEYGVTVGLVTIEDVAEELLGSLSDGPDSPDIEPVGPGRWRVAGSMPVEDLKSELGVPIPEGDWNTAAGLMLGVAGRILGWGESVEVGGFEMTVSEVDGRRITRIDVAKQGRRRWSEGRSGHGLASRRTTPRTRTPRRAGHCRSPRRSPGRTSPTGARRSAPRG